MRSSTIVAAAYVRRRREWFRPKWSRAGKFGSTLIAVLLLVFAVAAIRPATASAAVQTTYAQGHTSPGSVFYTPGFGPRLYNQVWHQLGYSWDACYTHTDGSWGTCAYGNGNPTKDSNDDGYAKADCYDVDDNSGVQFTCQTTKPS
jgi:hypothetical protein